MVEASPWGLIGATSLLLGAINTEWRAPRTRLLGLDMGFGAGVLLSAVSFELVEEAVETAGGLRSTTFGLCVGAIVFTAGDVAVSRLGYANRKDIAGAPSMMPRG